MKNINFIHFDKLILTLMNFIYYYQIDFNRNTISINNSNHLSMIHKIACNFVIFSIDNYCNIIILL